MPSPPTFVYEVQRALKTQYEDFNHNNPKTPLWNLVFVLLSVQTTKTNYERVYSQLRARYRTLSDLAEAEAEELVKLLRPAGLAEQKAKHLKGIFAQLKSEYGRPTLSPLRKMSDSAAERFLCSLPGVGIKVARCVMMSTLGREVFPVDTHCWRICRRLGWVRATAHGNAITARDMDRIQNRIPSEIRFSLHVNMISLGREYCISALPRCDLCPIVKYCKKVGTGGSKRQNRELTS